MKVLLVAPGHPDLSGDDAARVAAALFAGLRATGGVQPVLLAAVDRATPALFKPGAHITAFDGRADQYLFLAHDIDPWWHRNREPLLVEAFADFLGAIAPDVVHVHDFARTGADLLSLTRRVRPAARIVATLHDFTAICAADGRMIRRVGGAACDHATPLRCHQCFPERSPEDCFLRERWLKAHLAAADVCTVPAEHMLDRFAAWGLDRARLALVPHALDWPPPRPAARRAKRNRFGCCGPPDAAGAALLAEAVRLLRDDGFDDFVLEPGGDLPSDPLGPALARIDWAVLPGLPGYGLAVAAAAAAGRPAIAADGVRDDIDGLRFTAGDAASLAETLRRAASEPGLWRRLAANLAPPVPPAAMTDAFAALYRGHDSG